jgi:hypothetical protein
VRRCVATIIIDQRKLLWISVDCRGLILNSYCLYRNEWNSANSIDGFPLLSINIDYYRPVCVSFIYTLDSRCVSHIHIRLEITYFSWSDNSPVSSGVARNFDPRGNHNELSLAQIKNLKIAISY